MVRIKQIIKKKFSKINTGRKQNESKASRELKQELAANLISQKILLEEINNILKKQTGEFSSSISKFQHDIAEKNKIIDELHEDKILAGVIKRVPHKQNLRTCMIIGFLVISSFVFSYQIYTDLALIPKSDSTPIKTEYLIQNLDGSTTATWKSWHLVDAQVLNVNIIDADKVSKEKLDAIKSAILEEKSIQVDNSLVGKGPAGTASTYYLGWQGALGNMPDGKTKFQIPKKFNLIESPNGEGDITIYLSNLENADGYSGYTKTMTDGNQIVKAAITIYNVNHMTPERLGDVARHEFGHALGLGHASDEQDLMYYMIETDYPLVSQCDTEAIQELYDGKTPSNLVCQK